MRLSQVLHTLALATLPAAMFAAQEPPLRDPRPFRTGIEITSITATVFDRNGALVKGLPREKFEIFEDGIRQEVSQFTAERVPVGLGLLLDTSDSMFGERMRDARAAVDEFLLKLLDPADEFFILAFNHDARVLTGWTSAPAVVRGALDGLHPFGATAAYDAVMHALPLIERRSRQRAALLVVSDGSDNASDATLREVRTALLRSDAFVYAIAIDSTERQAINAGVNAAALREITTDSGGRTEVVRTSAELPAAAARIAEELNSQYVLGYTSSHGADGRYHRIRVRAGGGEYRVRARNGYVATPISRVRDRQG